MARNLITCLLEYSKLDLEPTENLSLPTLERSTLWCIVRLRRFLSAYKNEGTANIDRLVNQVSEAIKSKQLSTETTTRLLDKCIALVDQKKAFSIIEMLVKQALSQEDADPLHFNVRKQLFSDRFVYHLFKNETENGLALRDHYLGWSNDIKIQLLIQTDDALEMEILDLIHDYTQPRKYHNPDEIDDSLRKKELIRLAQLSPKLSERLVQVLSKYVDMLRDWRVVQLVQCILCCLPIELYQQCKMATKKYTNDSAQAVYHLLSNHVYSGPLQNIPERRTMAWCISMSLRRTVWHCVNRIIEWCKNRTKWTKELNNTLEFINWIIYPSLDNRQQESFLELRNWIYSCQGTNNLNENFKKFPTILFNNNGMVIACFVTAFLMSDCVQTDQLESLLRGIFTLPSQENSKTKNNGLDFGAFYLFLDCMHDIQTHKDHYPDSLLPTSIEILGKYSILDVQSFQRQ